MQSSLSLIYPYFTFLKEFYLSLTEMLTKELIESRLNYKDCGFLGYGNLYGKIWFIGMEEGQTSKEKDLEKDLDARFKATYNKLVVDIQTDMKDVEDHIKWFKLDAGLQPTWKRLIRIHLIINNIEVNNERIRQFQINELGRLNSDHCLLELMPLPCKNLEKESWNKFYGKFSDEFPYLESRTEYKKEFLERRTKVFMQIIQEHHPEVVIFYSFSKDYIECWKRIAKAENKRWDQHSFKEKEKVLMYSYKEGTTYFIIPQPAYIWNDEKWNFIGTKIRETIND